MSDQLLKRTKHQDSNMNSKQLLFSICLFLAGALVDVSASNLKVITLNDVPVTGFDQGDADSPGPFIVGIAKTSE